MGRTITLIVLREVEPCPRNALWEIFSFEAAKVAAAAGMYQWRQTDHFPILEEIYRRYREAGIPMSYTFEDFRRDYAREIMKKMPMDERLAGLSPEERLRGLPPEERLLGLSDEDVDRLKVLLERRKPGRQ